MNQREADPALPPLDTPLQKAIPAWLLSTIVHLLVVILLALFVRTVPKSLPGEPDRAGSIVLARRSGSDEVEYFDNSDTQESEATREPLTHENPLVPSPSSDADLLIPDVKLPGKPMISVGSTNDLLTIPDITQQTGPPIVPDSSDVSEFLAEEMARIRNRGPKGPTARISLFGGSQSEGHSFVFLLDRSESMGGLGALDAAKQELLAALSRLNDNHHFQIIAYHHKTVYVGERTMRPASPDVKGEVPAYFNGLAPFGKTFHETALLSALRLNPDVIYVLSDGGDPKLTEPQITQISRRAGGTTIHCIEFGFGARQESNTFLEQLATRCGGTYAYVNMSAERDE